MQASVVTGILLGFGLLFAIILILLYYIIKQQGRLLLRLDAIEEQQRAAAGQNDTPAPGQALDHAPPVSQRLPAARPLHTSRIEREGLPAGTVAPAFELPDLNGQPVALASFRGRLLLVFSDPNCGPCDELMPALSRLHQGQAGSDLTIVLVGRGDPELNRRKAERYGLAFPILLQRRWEISRQYGIFSTPVACLIDEQGVIARDVALGAAAIVALAQSSLTALQEELYEQAL